MSVLTAGRNPTLLDLARAEDPTGQIAQVAEILNEVNEALDDWTFMEGNLTTGNMTNIRTGIPLPTWRKLGYGVVPTKGSLAQIVDTTGMLDAWAEQDVKLVDMAKDPAAFRLLEDAAHIEGMAQEASDTLFYGNEETESEAFTGLAPRYNDKSAESGDNIIDGGGTGNDNRSIWLIIWSPTTIFGIVPRNSKAGLQIEDLGKQTSETALDASGNPGLMRVYQSHYTWDLGLCVKDWRYIVRIPNIDQSLLTNDASTGADLPDLMFQALDTVPTLTRGRAAFYIDKNTRGFLRRQLSSAINMSTLTMRDVGGKMVTEFQGIPLRRCDSLATDETRVT